MSSKSSVFKEFDFSNEGIDDVKLTEKGTRWPVVYYINNDKEIYIGESTNAYNRMKNHLANKERKKLKKVTVISNDRFNKSATLDIESNLIQYVHADQTRSIQNKNKGVSGHNYYDRSSYNEILQEIWEEMKQRGVVNQNIKDLANSDIFKFSPYKTLTPSQYEVVNNILVDIASALENNEDRTIIVHGGAGTGKTVLATHLMKLLSDNSKKNVSTLDEIEEEKFNADLSVLENTTHRLVVPQSALRETLGNVFKSVKGLRKNMVIGASEILPKNSYDIISNNEKEITVAVVDEAHRLRRAVNISGFQYKQFAVNDKKIGVEDSNELDWIVKSSKVQVLFYDSMQSVKPTDITSDLLDKAIEGNKKTEYHLDSQMRVQGGDKYIKYINNILDEKNPHKETFNEYEFKHFNNIVDMVNAIKAKNDKYGLSRIVSGYSWKWETKDISLDKISKDNLYDIDIQGNKYIWNSTMIDWVNSNNAINEIGCIHTIQGYDLNYVGVIFGEEIVYRNGNIEIIKENYLDVNGKNTIPDDEPEILLNYIKNIYKVFLTRGIKGTYIYVVDEPLREYLKTFTESV